jgi:nucleotide-binding universal stress UspA family protein
MAIRNIVVGIDGSETSYRAFAMAVGLALREQGCIHACYVECIPATSTLGGFFAPLVPVDGPDSDDQLARFVTGELAQAGVRGDFVRRVGEVVDELERTTTTCAADLVVVGRSTHPHRHLGGVPHKLLTRGLHPVLVVP